MKCIQTHYSPHGPPEMTVNSVLSQVTCVSMTEERLGPTRKSRWLSQSFVRTRRPVSQAAPTRCAHWGWPVLLLGEREVRPCARSNAESPAFSIGLHNPVSVSSLLPWPLPKGSQEEANPGWGRPHSMSKLPGRYAEQGLGRQRRRSLGWSLGRLIQGSAMPGASGWWRAWNGHWTLVPPRGGP